MINKKYSSC